MGVFEQFPYTNMQNANLDWVLNVVRQVEAAMGDGFDKYISAWIEQNYNKLFFNASYDAETETIIFAKGGEQ